MPLVRTQAAKRAHDDSELDSLEPPAKQARVGGRSALGDISNKGAKGATAAVTATVQVDGQAANDEAKRGIRARTRTAGVSAGPENPSHPPPGDTSKSATAKQTTVSTTLLPTPDTHGSRTPALSPISASSNTSLSSADASPADPSTLLAQWSATIGLRKCTDYSDAIFQHLRLTELIDAPHYRYMDAVQGDLSYPMRAILIDWLVEVVEEYHLQLQTFYLSIAYIDRYLARIPIERGKLQLVGLSAMLIASKYWEIYPPTIDDFIHICDNTYKREEILETEKSMLGQLQFRLVIPTAWELNRRFATARLVSDECRSLSEYLMELVTQEIFYLKYRPSVIACAVTLVATITMAGCTHASPAWSKLMASLSGYSYDEITECATSVHRTHIKVFHDANGWIAQGNAGFKAVKEKYSHAAHKRVAAVRPNESVEW